MTYRTFQKTGEKVSLLGYGAMRLPTVDHEIVYEKAEALIDMAYENGVNYYDTAYGYHHGTSQIVLGKALKKYDRNSFYLANKLPIWECKCPEDLERVFNEQLEKCQVDYFDFYLLHSMNEDHYAQCENLHAYDFIKQKQAEGKIKHIGFSFHDTPELLEKICSDHEWDFAQIQLNYLDWELQRAKEQYEILCKHNLPCIVMEPVRGGALSNLAGDANDVLKEYAPDASISSWAIKYVASLPNVLTVLSGMTIEEHVVDNLKSVKDFVPLTDEERTVLQKALEIHKQVSTLPCTGCRYCIDCPAEVNIPEIFRVYNYYQLNRNGSLFVKDMDAIAEAGHGCENCVRCGACMEQCPQKIEIPDELEKIQELYLSMK